MARGTGDYATPPRLPEGSVSLPDLLTGSGPLELVIGPGRGAFILDRCEQRNDVRVLGLEIRRKWATLVDERLQERFEGRARVVCEDAKLALPRLTPDGCLARAFIHFPDPWWKKRHRKRLVIVDPLIGEVARLLATGGELFIQTDVPERGQQYAAVVSQQALLEPFGNDGPAIDHNPYEGRSNRERRADEDGLPVYRYRWRRLA